MGNLLIDTPEVRAATTSAKLHSSLDLIEGDFLAWKKIEQKLISNHSPHFNSLIDISSASSMNVFDQSFDSSTDIDSKKIWEKVQAYPFIIPKERNLENEFARFISEQSDKVIQPNEVVVFNGVYASMRTTVLAMSGRYVLMPEFTNHAQKMSVSAMGKIVVEVSMFAPGWTLDLRDLRQKLDEFGGDVSCMYIYHALSADITESYLSELANLLAEYVVVPIFDIDVIKTAHTSIYSPLLAMNNAYFTQFGMFLFNMSKEFGAPGIRIGFGVASPSLVQKIKKFQQISLEMVPPTSRYLAECILKNYDFPKATQHLVDRMKCLVGGLQSLEMEATLPNIGVNLFMHVPRSFEYSKQVLPDHLFSYYCLTRAGVILRPASVYGHRLNHFVRFVVGQKEEVINEMIIRFKDVGIHGKMELPEDLEAEYQSNLADM